MPTEHIHIIEDQADIINLVKFNLEAEGFSVTSSRDGAEGLDAVRRAPPDLLILDLGLPSLDGFHICQQLKQDEATRQVPILILTVRGGEPDIVQGLRLGADDYVTKPFRIGELIARVKAVRRRYRETAARAEQRVIEAAGVRIDLDRFEVLVDGEPVVFTPTEFRLLQTLAALPGRVFTRENLIDTAVGDDVCVMDHNIDVHIGNIRKKLGERRELIETVWGVGYRFRE
ncbi:response regulator transcription factor [bacterium]|nr:response regulator transcription factor [bacterium]